MVQMEPAQASCRTTRWLAIEHQPVTDPHSCRTGLLDLTILLA
jgi:hypothetical protein